MNPFIEISVHSYVDLITNSSSETFITATTRSIDLIKELIDLHLNDACYAETCEQLFDIKLVYTDYDYDDKTGNETQVEKEGESEYRPSRIRVSVKAGITNQKLTDLANLLNKFNTLLTANEYMC